MYVPLDVDIADGRLIGSLGRRQGHSKAHLLALAWNVNISCSAMCRALSNVAEDGLLTEGFFWIPSLGGPTTLAAQKAVCTVFNLLIASSCPARHLAEASSAGSGWHACKACGTHVHLHGSACSFTARLGVQQLGHLTFTRKGSIIRRPQHAVANRKMFRAGRRLLVAAAAAGRGATHRMA